MTYEEWYERVQGTLEKEQKERDQIWYDEWPRLKDAMEAMKTGGHAERMAAGAVLDDIRAKQHAASRLAWEWLEVPR